MQACQERSSLHAHWQTALTSRLHLGGIFCCKSQWMETCKGMPQVAQRGLSSGPQCMDLKQHNWT